MASNSIIAPATYAGVGAARSGARPEVIRTARLTRRGRILVKGIMGSALAAVVAATAVRIATAATSEPTRLYGAPATVTVVVQPGDSLWSIASRLNTPEDPREIVSEIKEVNQLASSRIMPGDVLIVPLHR